MKRTFNRSCRILNVTEDHSDGPGIMAKAHLITVSPRPPESSEEDGRMRTSRISFEPALRIFFKKVVLGSKPEFRKIAIS
jgi:hypothetical protein